jgi:hypothetical protein
MTDENSLLPLFSISEIDTLDFKREIPDLSDKAKLPEFIKDVIAIGNSVYKKNAKRGYLIFGVENKTRAPRSILGQVANAKTISTDSRSQREINELNQKEIIQKIKDYVHGFFGEMVVNYFSFPNPNSPENLAGVLEITAINGPFFVHKEIEKFDSKGKQIGVVRKRQSWIRNGEDTSELYPDDLYKLANSKKVFQGLEPVAQVVDFSTYNAAETSAIKKYYEGHPLKWGIILANGDVERDIAPKIENKLNEKPEESKIICITGDVGAGKSTLAWRLAYQYSTSKNVPLIQVWDSDSPQTWYQIESVATSYKDPLVVLVDDVFRSEMASRALSVIGESSKITIIATSRRNEVPRDLSFQMPMQVFRLGKPSVAEISLALNKLNLLPEKLEPGFLHKIQKTPSWLLMMYELTGGEDLQKRVRSSVNQLQKLDDIVFRAYEYICFGSQYDLSFPENLLLNLDAKGYFYGVKERPASQGVIFRTYRPGFLRSLHALISKEALLVYQRDPIFVLDELISAANPEDYYHRLFIFNLIDRLVATSQLNRIGDLLNKQAVKIEYIIRNSSITELSAFQLNSFRKINDEARVEQIERIITTKPPETASDWAVLADKVIISGSKEDGRKLTEKISAWLIDHDDGHVKSLYLRLVETFGNENMIRKLIDESHLWLQINPEKTDYRQRYLNLVSKNGTKGQIERAIQDTSEWFEKYPTAINVQQKFLALVAKHGTNSQANKFIEKTSATFEANLMDFALSAAFLTMVNRRGSDLQLRKVLNLSLEWLRYHPDDTEIRKTIIGIINEREDVESANKIIDDSFDWLKGKPENIGIRPALLSLVASKGTHEHINRAKQDTQLFLRRNSDKRNILISYFELIEICGSIDEQKALLAEGIDWLKQYPTSTKIRLRVMQTAIQLGTRDQISFLVSFNKDWEVKIKDKVFTQVYKALIQKLGKV